MSGSSTKGMAQRASFRDGGTTGTGPARRWGGGVAWLRSALLAAGLALAGSAVVAACGGDDNQLAPPGGTSSSSSSGGGTCAEGAERECHVTIGEHEGVLTCMDGVQRCEGGAWTECGDGVTRTRSAPRRDSASPAVDRGAGARPSAEPEYPQPLSLSSAAPCVGNPCDPTCQNFDENPPGGVTPPGVVPPYPWTVGDINALPDSVLSLGNHEPCTTAEDCQFDQYCDNPARGACAHSLCAAGTGVNETCSSCATKICDSGPTADPDADPSCCLETYAGACDHDPCAASSPLKASCDPCVAAICALRPMCCIPGCTSNADCPSGTCDMVTQRCTCTTSSQCPAGYGSSACSSNRCVPFWGQSQCVSQIPIVCGKTCPAPNPWSQACVNKVDTVCGADCDPPPGTCTHDKCYTGARLVSSCEGAGACVAQICAVEPLCCSSAGSWKQSCVDKVESVCGLTCAPKGNCVSWLPGTSDASCAEPDLTLGVPCGGTVPVCNRGTMPVGPGVEIVSYPAGSGNMPSSAPNKVKDSCNPPAGTVACTTTASIAPGDCISVAGCVGLSDGMELMVNPPGGAHVNECHCENNWSVYQSAMCSSPACIASANVSIVRKVSMFVSVDKSTSMQASGSGCPPGNTANLASRWTPATNALKTFFQDPTSAGINVALRFWSDKTPFTNEGPCGDWPSCPGPGGGACAVPQVPLGALTAASAPADTQEAALVNQINMTTPCGDTPIYPALDGATSWGINRKLAFPDEEVLVVFVTDGAPNVCNTDVTAITSVAGSAYYNYGVRTYAIGFGNSNPTLIEQIAAAGGGTAFLLNTGAGLEGELVSAMQAIRGDALSCDVTVPVAGVMDPSQVSVTYTNNMGVTTTLTKQPSLAGCGTGWYFDPANPEIVKLCPTTCSTIQAAQGGKVQAVVPCDTTYNPFTYSQTYEASCPAGSKVQWGYLSYDTTTPGDSNVQIQVRTADTAAGLSSAMYMSAASAHATPTDTQVCPMAGPFPCPVDLFSALGGLPDARRDFLEVTMTLNPTGDKLQAPTVNTWEITYSCPPSE